MPPLVLAYEKELPLPANDGSKRILPCHSLYRGSFDLAGALVLGNYPGKPSPVESFLFYASNYDSTHQEVFGAEDMEEEIITQHQSIDFLDWYPELIPKGYTVLLLLKVDETRPIKKSEEAGRLVVVSLTLQPNGVGARFDRFNKNELIYSDIHPLIVKKVKKPVMFQIPVEELD